MLRGPRVDRRQWTRQSHPSMHWFLMTSPPMPIQFHCWRVGSEALDQWPPVPARRRSRQSRRLCPLRLRHVPPLGHLHARLPLPPLPVGVPQQRHPRLRLLRQLPMRGLLLLLSLVGRPLGRQQRLLLWPSLLLKSQVLRRARARRLRVLGGRLLRQRPNARRPGLRRYPSWQHRGRLVPRGPQFPRRDAMLLQTLSHDAQILLISQAHERASLRHLLSFHRPVHRPTRHARARLVRQLRHRGSLLRRLHVRIGRSPLCGPRFQRPCHGRPEFRWRSYRPVRDHPDHRPATPGSQDPHHVVRSATTTA